MVWVVWRRAVPGRAVTGTGLGESNEERELPRLQLCPGSSYRPSHTYLGYHRTSYRPSHTYLGYHRTSVRDHSVGPVIVAPPWPWAIGSTVLKTEVQ